MLPWPTHSWHRHRPDLDRSDLDRSDLAGPVGSTNDSSNVGLPGQATSIDATLDAPARGSDSLPATGVALVALVALAVLLLILGLTIGSANGTARRRADRRAAALEGR